MSGKTILVWFRNDLRVHDNEILLEAVKRAELVIPVFCFDPRYFELSTYGTKKTGVLRAKFLLQSISGLRASLKELGGELLVRLGKPEDVLPGICDDYEVTEVYHHREVAATETKISSLVEEALWKKQINLKHFIGHTLYHKEDLPFPIKNIPNDYVIFRKKVERDSTVKPCFDTPSVIRVPKDMETGELPTLNELDLLDAEALNLEVKGGEQEGLLQLNSLITVEAPSARVKNSVSPFVLSPWLSMGCLSMREVYWAVKNEKRAGIADMATKTITELQWRDFFRFMLKKHGYDVLNNIECERPLTDSEQEKFVKWQRGETGAVLVDACMRELNATGLISDKVKQFVSAYLITELALPWRAGAAYFEEKCLDHSPAIDWGNWIYIYGAGIMSSNRPLSVKAEEIADDQNIKKRLFELSV